MALKEGTANKVITLYAPLLIGLFGAVAAGIQAWDVLEKRQVTITSVLSVTAWVIGVLLMVWSTYLNLRDAKREKRLRSQIVTLKDEYQTQIGGLEKRLSEETEAYQLENAALRDKHERDIRDGRKIVIHEAWWGAGGVRHIYSKDISAHLSYLWERYEQQKVELRATDETMGDGGYPGEEWKALFVRFSCPCSTRALEHTFKYGDVIDLESLCRRG